jgi:hypothetical protein
MPAPFWRPGAFAERYPSQARDVGRAHKLEAVANRLLFATAGVVDPHRIHNASYGDVCSPCAPGEAPRGCCGSPCLTQGADSCCARGSCAHCGPGEDDFAAIYPKAVRELDACHAYAAALRDILTDPDVEDVAGAVAQATQLHEKGKLAALYAPQAPAKKLPSGETAPARCPVCGATVCPTCGCSCECCSSAHEKKPAAPAAEQ